MSDYPTAGDFAWSAANQAQASADALSREVTALKHRVMALENTVVDLLTALAKDGIVDVVDPE